MGRIGALVARKEKLEAELAEVEEELSSLSGQTDPIVERKPPAAKKAAGPGK